jgi:hypothetical protein
MMLFVDERRRLQINSNRYHYEEMTLSGIGIVHIYDPKCILEPAT